LGIVGVMIGTASRALAEVVTKATAAMSSAGTTQIADLGIPSPQSERRQRLPTTPPTGAHRAADPGGKLPQSFHDAPAI
jgi:hypothetical protein